MSNQNPPRSVQEIQTDYSNSCLKAGNLQYEIACKEKDLSLLNDRLRELNFEYVAAKNMEAEITKKVAEEKKATEDKAAKEAEAAKPALELVKETPNV